MHYKGGTLDVLVDDTNKSLLIDVIHDYAEKVLTFEVEFL